MKNFLLYGLASGFNRGGMFLILPLLSSLLSIVEYGRFSIYIVVVQLLVPFLSLNIVSIIGREVFEKFKITVFFTVLFNRAALVAILLCIACYLFSFNVYFLIIIYALLEAIFLLTSTFVRFRSSAEGYFYICISKMALLICMLVAAYIFNRPILSDVDTLLIIFASSNLVIIFPYLRLTFLFRVKLKALFSLLSKQQAIMLFALGILPHTLAQWVTSGSDRFFVKYFNGDVQLGYYSYGYAIAAVYMVINSALALGVPQYCVQKFNVFSGRKFYSTYFVLVSSLWLLFLAVISVGLFSIKTKYNARDVFWIVYFVLVGLYFLSFYYYYSSYLFYARKSKQLSGITISVAVINVVLILILAPMFGITGTAISTAASYFIYTFITYKYAAREFNVIDIKLPVLVVMVSGVVVGLIGSFTRLLS